MQDACAAIKGSLTRIDARHWGCLHLSVFITRLDYSSLRLDIFEELLLGRGNTKFASLPSRSGSMLPFPGSSHVVLMLSAAKDDIFC